MSDPTCPSCVKLFSVHRPTNWVRCWLITSVLFLFGSVFLLFASTQSIALILIVAAPLCYVCYAVFHFLRCSHFLIGLDGTGHLHLHKRNKPVLCAELVLEVTAGALRRKCKLYCGDPIRWMVSANNNYFFFTDPSGEMFSVSYCEKPHHAATGYISHEQNMSGTLRLIRQQTYFGVIRHLALQKTEASLADSPIAGSISANQG